MSDFGRLFGQLVARKREERGWSLAQLAVAAYGDDGEGGEKRKSDVLKLEQGKARKPNAATIRKYRLALELTQDEIDACRTPAEIELAQFARKLFEVIAEAGSQAGLSEDLTSVLAERYADGNPDDFDAALRGVMRALEVAREDRARLPSNLDAAVNDIIARIDAMNDEGLVEDALEEIRREVDAQKERSEEAVAALERLQEKALAQAILSRSVPEVVKEVLSTLPPGDEGHEGLRVAYLEWMERGRDKGLNFDLEVSVALARFGMEAYKSRVLAGNCSNDLGVSLALLGERESGTNRLEEAVAAYRVALEERNRDQLPMAWSQTQGNLGNVLALLGEREGGTDRLEEAIAAYQSVLEEVTRDGAPMDWARTQMNLGNALRILGERESGNERLKQAVAAYRLALEERTRERVPLHWATTQMNLGTALRALGEREKGPDRLEEAVAAYRAALEESTRERVPLSWAIVRVNLAGLKVIMFDRTGRSEHLIEAEACICAARDVFEEAQASQYLAIAEIIIADISKRRVQLK